MGKEGAVFKWGSNIFNITSALVQVHCSPCASIHPSSDARAHGATRLFLPTDADAGAASNTSHGCRQQAAYIKRRSTQSLQELRTVCRPRSVKLIRVKINTPSPTRRSLLLSVAHGTLAKYRRCDVRKDLLRNRSRLRSYNLHFAHTERRKGEGVEDEVAVREEVAFTPEHLEPTAVSHYK
ncbi:hypothetical protein ZHAS_00013787 [Anopheles sinensis]|uniref:Uncharacterized protein n=1 Tax=Anopheles sinensis TaxID=74873 RepID=A0A084W6G3_ANOSI|nr:hypothetical protein ZHAS_00013787 [Anopheles sinensis]